MQNRDLIALLQDHDPYATVVIDAKVNLDGEYDLGQSDNVEVKRGRYGPRSAVVLFAHPEGTLSEELEEEIKEGRNALAFLGNFSDILFGPRSSYSESAEEKIARLEDLHDRISDANLL
jgi:hypothetical protein